MTSYLTLFYQNLFNFVAKARIVKNDISLGSIHTFLICVFTTSLLMWGFAIVAHVSISSSVPMVVGYICCLLHFFSPLIYRFTNNHFTSSGFMLSCMIVHQSTFAFYSGGFDSNIIIWFAILPTLAGFIAGRKGVITWFLISTITIAVFLGLKLTGFHFPYLITENGLLLLKILLSLGWIFVSTSIIWVYIMLDEMHTTRLKNKKQSIQNLVYILSHDVSNSIAVVVMRLEFLRKKIKLSQDETKYELPLSEKKNLDIIFQAAQVSTQIVDNVKELYAVELGKKEISMAEVKLSTIFESIKVNFGDKLQVKKCNLECSIKPGDLVIHSNQALLTHQILGNLISNSIKFSIENANIFLEASLQNGKIQIIVSDHGIGIPKDIRNKLFELKAVTSRPGTNGETGTGFGLPIVKVYVVKLGGTIKVESQTAEDNLPTTGTKFIIEFPLV